MNLTRGQHDALTELVNIGVGRAAAALSELCGERIDVSVPHVLVCRLGDLPLSLPDEELLEMLVYEDFEGALSGRAILAFPRAGSQRLGQLLGHIASLPELVDLDLRGILTEVGNLVLNGVVGTIANVANARLFCLVPELVPVADPASVLTGYLACAGETEHSVFVANVDFGVARHDIQGAIFVLFQCDGITSLLDSLIAESV